MQGVKDVRQLDERHVHWVAEVGGKQKEWDAEISEQIPDKRIAWHSVGGTKNDGIVEFDPVSQDDTRVTVRMEYEPEGLVENVADFFGTTSNRVEGDLKRFKSFVESRGSETGAWRGQIEEGSKRGAAESASSLARGEHAGGQRLPEAEEELVVGKHEVPRGTVRAHTTVTEERAEEQVRLREDHARVERHPTDRPLAPGEDPF